MKHYINGWKKFGKTGGRATRKELWMFILFNIIVAFVFALADVVLGIFIDNSAAIISTVYSVAVICPVICLYSRRLHDVDKSGWWQLLIFIPFVNFYLFYLIFFKRGTDGVNRFGAPAGAAAVVEPVYGAYSVPVENEFSAHQMCPAAQAVKSCAYCGAKLEAEAKFCSNCGAPSTK